MSEHKPTDLLGIAPYGEAAKILVEKSTDTAQQFLYDICRPAAGELGLLFRDSVRAWRARNAAKIAGKARGLVEVNSEGVQLQAHPRLFMEVVEHGSLCEDDNLQTMWAGLLVSSCTSDGRDDSNLLFTDILKRLTGSEARLLGHVCELGINQKPISTLTNHTFQYRVSMPEDEIVSVMGTSRSLVPSQLAHLCSLGLLEKRHEFDALSYQIAGHQTVHPEPLAVHLYVRCQGSRLSPDEYIRVRHAASYDETPLNDGAPS